MANVDNEETLQARYAAIQTEMESITRPEVIASEEVLVQTEAHVKTMLDALHTLVELRYRSEWEHEIPSKLAEWIETGGPTDDELDAALRDDVTAALNEAMRTYEGKDVASEIESQTMVVYVELSEAVSLFIDSRISEVVDMALNADTAATTALFLKAAEQLIAENIDVAREPFRRMDMMYDYRLTQLQERMKHADAIILIAQSEEKINEANNKLMECEGMLEKLKEGAEGICTRRDTLVADWNARLQYATVAEVYRISVPTSSFEGEAEKVCKQIYYNAKKDASEKLREQLVAERAVLADKIQASMAETSETLQEAAELDVQKQVGLTPNTEAVVSEKFDVAKSVFAEQDAQLNDLMVSAADLTTRIRELKASMDACDAKLRSHECRVTDASRLVHNTTQYLKVLPDRTSRAEYPIDMSIMELESDMESMFDLFA